MNAISPTAILLGEVIQPAGNAGVASIGPFRAHSSGWKGSFRSSRRSLGAPRAHLRQGPQPREVVGGHRQSQKLVDLDQSLHHHLADRADELAPAEALLDALSLALADLVARVAGGAPIDGAAAAALDVLCHVRRDVDRAARLDEAPGVVGLVRAHCDAFARPRNIGQHLRSHVSLSCSVRGTGLYVHDQAMAVVGQHMTQVTRQRRRRLALAVQPRLGVARGFVRIVAARLTVPVLGRAVAVRSVLAPHALVAGPGLDERAVDAEVLTRQQSTLVGHFHGSIEEFGDRVVLDEAVAVLAEDRVVPHSVLDGQADEPAKQQVVLDLLDELPLAAHAVEHLQQHRAHQLLGRDAGAPALYVGLVHGRQLGVHRRQRLVDPDPDRTQWVVGRDKVLQSYRGEKALVVAVRSSHRWLPLVDQLRHVRRSDRRSRLVFQRPAKRLVRWITPEAGVGNDRKFPANVTTNGPLYCRGIDKQSAFVIATNHEKTVTHHDHKLSCRHRGRTATADHGHET